jgi:hypothetical protein
MAAEQGKGMGTGRVPGLNTERIYSTTVPADELAQALADHFRAQGFETQVFRTSGDRTAMQARKESLWRNLLGVAYALTVVFTPGEGQLSIGLGGHEWIDAAISGGIGLVAVPPVLLGTAYGIWKENQLDKEVWQVIDERVSAPAEAGPWDAHRLACLALLCDCAMPGHACTIARAEAVSARYPGVRASWCSAGHRPRSR